MGIQGAVRFNIAYFLIVNIGLQTPGPSLIVIKIEISAEKKRNKSVLRKTAVVGKLPSTYYHPQCLTGISWINIWLLVKNGWEAISLAKEMFQDFRSIAILHQRGWPNHCYHWNHIGGYLHAK